MIILAQGRKNDKVSNYFNGLWDEWGAPFPIEPYEGLFDDREIALQFALALAEQDCHILNGGTGQRICEIYDNTEETVKVCRWDDNKREHTAIFYTFYPVTETNEEIRKKDVYCGEHAVIRYRGYNIFPNKSETGFSIKMLGVSMKVVRNLKAALRYMDDMYFCGYGKRGIPMKSKEKQEKEWEE